MGKKLLIPCIVFCMLITMVVVIQAADNKAQLPGNTAKFQTQMLPKAKAANLPVFDMKLAADPVIFSDDFEGAVNWVVDASWNHVSTASGGRAYQPVSSWEYITTNSHSPSHSWHAKLGLDEELDFVISPVIYVPKQVVTGGITSPLKGLKLGYWLDADIAQGTNSWHHLVGSAECWWQFSKTDPGAGTSSWYLEPHDIQHWRQWLTTPVINLTGATSDLKLTFKHKYNSEVDFDYYSVDISTDNFISYKTLAFYEGSTKQLAWVDVSLDIAAYAGQTVKIRFSSKGDYGTAEGFWGIDEIKVADGTTTFFYDDGGETGATTITKAGFAPGARFKSYTSTTAQPAPNWIEMPAFDVAGFGTAIKPGDSIRIAIQWESDGKATAGRGFFIDDVTLYGVGTLEYDLAVLGIVGLENAVVDKKLNLGVVVANQGLNKVTAILQWNGEILDASGAVVWPAVFGRTNVTDFAPGTTIVIPTFAAREWLVEKPGDYVFRGSLVFAQDGDISNNSFKVDFMVYGAPYTNVVYRQDFFPRAGEKKFEDFGFTVINGGGCTKTGLNVNTWEYHSGLIYGKGGALLSYAWGHLDPGTDKAAPYDSSEVLDESLITPEFDISGIGPFGTLFMRYYVYFRTYHPALGLPFGLQKTYFDISFTIDDGKTWISAFNFADDDGLANDARRLPNIYVPTVLPNPAIARHMYYLGADMTPAVKMGGKKMKVRINLKSENSYITGVSFEDMVVYGGIDYARITSVADIPADQGKQVRVTWKAAFNDLKIWKPTDLVGDQYEQRIVTHYELRRLIPGGTYDYIATIPAHFDEVYNYVAPTLQDGVETWFMVSARTSDPMVFVDSKPLGGKSVDNLAPSAPMNLAAVGQNNTNILTWEASPEPDVKYYSIYRSETSGNYPATPLAYATDVSFTDATVTVGKTYYYVVTATDFGANESKPSNETSVLTSVDDNSSSTIPTEFALDQNYPNPFNPTTYINYQLPTDSYVTITIYNTNGQEIKTLVSKDMKAGYHAVAWDGTNNAGQNVTSGLYFYKMKAGAFSDMKKMMLVR